MATILVVDDEFGIVQILAAILEDQRYKVLTAANGRQALERLAESKVDLVLTDYMMPSFDGPALIRAMASSPVLRAIPVIFMSSLPAAQVAETVTGFAAYLRKPFRIHVVLETISAALGNSEQAL